MISQLHPKFQRITYPLTTHNVPAEACSTLSHLPGSSVSHKHHFCHLRKRMETMVDSGVGTHPQQSGGIPKISYISKPLPPEIEAIERLQGLH